MPPILLTGGPGPSLGPTTGGERPPNLWNEPRPDPEMREKRYSNVVFCARLFKVI